MKTSFSILSSITLLIICLFFPLTGLTQQQPNENSITKDISLTHIDGNTTLNLDLSKHLGLTGAELKKLAENLSIGVLEKTPDTAKGVTIEMLKPIESTFQPKALVLREIITYPPKVMGVLYESKKENWLNNSKDLSEKLVEEFDKVITQFQSEIISPQNTILIKIYNTTKSRINLKNWKIRITYGTMPDDNTERVIDGMSNVNVGKWKPAKSHKPIEPLYEFYGVTLSRKIDFELLNDTTKTQNEQLSAISDGTLKAGWDMKKSPNLPQWIEIHNTTGQLKHMKDPLILVIPNKKSEY